MEEQLISFETAKLAKEKGFDYYVECSYWEGELTFFTPGYALENGKHCEYENYLKYPRYLVPTQSLLQKWLREKHNIDVVISPERYSDGVNYLVQAQKWDLNADPEVNLNFVIKGSCWYNDNHEYPTYEEALEKGLQEALKLI